MTVICEVCGTQSEGRILPPKKGKKMIRYPYDREPKQTELPAPINRETREKKDAMRMLDQMQDVLLCLEKEPDRMPTNRLLLMTARVAYWLLERWIRERS